MVMWARITLITALEADVPIERISALSPLAAAVSDGGTDVMMSAGMAAYARPTPAAITEEPMITCQAERISPSVAAYPAAITRVPASNAILGP